MSDRVIYIIAGPNGAGKTTFAQRFIPATVNITQFVNADLIAYGLSPFAPEREAIQAGKLMLRQEFFTFKRSKLKHSVLCLIEIFSKTRFKSVYYRSSLAPGPVVGGHNDLSLSIVRFA